MFRRCRAAIAVLVLLGQVAVGLGAATFYWRSSGRLAAAACECSHSSGATMCPMHKAAAAARCRLQSTHDGDVFVLASLLGSAGLLPAAVSVTAPVRTTVSARPPASPTRSLRPVPDSPPPRG